MISNLETTFPGWLDLSEMVKKLNSTQEITMHGKNNDQVQPYFAQLHITRKF